MYRDLSQPFNVQKNIKLYTGTGNHALAAKIAENLGLEISGLELSKFANGEVYARFETQPSAPVPRASPPSFLTTPTPARTARLPRASPSRRVSSRTCSRPRVSTASLRSTCIRARFRASLTSPSPTSPPSISLVTTSSPRASIGTTPSSSRRTPAVPSMPRSSPTIWAAVSPSPTRVARATTWPRS